MRGNVTLRGWFTIDGPQLVEYRLRHKLTRAALARRLNSPKLRNCTDVVTAEDIALWERGLDDPCCNVGFRLAEVLGVDVSDVCVRTPVSYSPARLTAARRTYDRSVRWVAKQLGVTPREIRALESGRVDTTDEKAAQLVLAYSTLTATALPKLRAPTGRRRRRQAAAPVVRLVKREAPGIARAS
jgi:transcriptional regulator with XRE-family HTH domain